MPPLGEPGRISLSGPLRRLPGGRPVPVTFNPELRNGVDGARRRPCRRAQRQATKRVGWRVKSGTICSACSARANGVHFNLDSEFKIRMQRRGVAGLHSLSSMKLRRGRGSRWVRRAARGWPTSEVGFNNGMNPAQILPLGVLGAWTAHSDYMLPVQLNYHIKCSPPPFWIKTRLHFCFNLPE